MSARFGKGPRKLNVVSILIFLGVAFGGYCAVRLGPPYWTQWQLKEVLRDGCTKMYQAKKYNQEARRHEYEKLQDRIHKAMLELGIDDPEATVELDDEDPDWVVVRASYDVVVSHPVGQPTVMHFNPEAKMDARPVDWDKK